MLFSETPWVFSETPLVATLATGKLLDSVARTATGVAKLFPIIALYVPTDLSYLSFTILYCSPFFNKS